jgi:hypothetical protein
MSILTLLVLAVGVAQAAAPAPSSTPPPTIIRIKSTPFCQVFRDNILQAVEGLRFNDRVISEGKSTLSKWAYDSVLENSRVDDAGIHWTIISWACSCTKRRRISGASTAYSTIRIASRRILRPMPTVN